MGAKRGWYPDPLDGDRYRYWSGKHWWDGTKGADGNPLHGNRLPIDQRRTAEPVTLKTPLYADWIAVLTSLLAGPLFLFTMAVGLMLPFRFGLLVFFDVRWWVVVLVSLAHAVLVAALTLGLGLAARGWRVWMNTPHGPQDLPLPEGEPVKRFDSGAGSTVARVPVASAVR